LIDGIVLTAFPGGRQSGFAQRWGGFGVLVGVGDFFGKGDRDMAGQLTILAEFETTAETHQKFLEICAYDSERSVADEPGCEVFDALTPQDQADTVILYEVYKDRAAFDAHLETPHYKKFAAAVESLGIRLREIRYLTRRAP